MGGMKRVFTGKMGSSDLEKIFKASRNAKKTRLF